MITAVRIKFMFLAGKKRAGGGGVLLCKLEGGGGGSYSVNWKSSVPSPTIQLKSLHSLSSELKSKHLEICATTRRVSHMICKLGHAQLFLTCCEYGPAAWKNKTHEGNLTCTFYIWIKIDLLAISIAPFVNVI